MNLIKWLKINSDIKLGKLKTEIKKNDVIVVKGSPDKMDRYIGERLHKVLPDNLIIFLPRGMTLEEVSEREMDKAGWIRK
jgi:hypothetical protein